MNQAGTHEILEVFALGSGIHGYVPEDCMVSFMGKDAWWAVPAALILGKSPFSGQAAPAAKP